MLQETWNALGNVRRRREALRADQISLDGPEWLFARGQYWSLEKNWKCYFSTVIWVRLFLSENVQFICKLSLNNYNLFLTHPVSYRILIRVSLILAKKKKHLLFSSKSLPKHTSHRGFKCVAYTVRDSTGYQTLQRSKFQQPVSSQLIYVTLVLSFAFSYSTRIFASRPRPWPESYRTLGTSLAFCMLLSITVQCEW